MRTFFPKFFKIFKSGYAHTGKTDWDHPTPEYKPGPSQSKKRTIHKFKVKDKKMLDKLLPTDPDKY